MRGSVFLHWCPHLLYPIPLRCNASRRRMCASGKWHSEAERFHPITRFAISEQALFVGSPSHRLPTRGLWEKRGQHVWQSLTWSFLNGNSGKQWPEGFKLEGGLCHSWCWDGGHLTRYGWLKLKKSMQSTNPFSNTNMLAFVHIHRIWCNPANSLYVKPFETNLWVCGVKIACLTRMLVKCTCSLESPRELRPLPQMHNPWNSF